jgi:alpha-beta hydrolase superfamily lysophospholipase
MTDPVIQRQTHVYRRGLSLDYACGPDRPKALVAYAHGGSFMTGSRDDRLARHFSGDLARRGLAFASIDYRKGGNPLQGMPEARVAAIERAVAESQLVYPEIAGRLFGPLLYRAVEDLSSAVDWLRLAPEGPALGDVPLIVMGLSAGALAAMGYAWGLDGLDPAAKAPALALGVAAVPPQPWRITPGHPTSGAVLLARGDPIMPRAAAARLAGDMTARACNVDVAMIPYGQHNRPVRELIPTEASPAGEWKSWVQDRISRVLDRKADD